MFGAGYQTTTKLITSYPYVFLSMAHPITCNVCHVVIAPKGAALRHLDAFVLWISSRIFSLLPSVFTTFDEKRQCELQLAYNSP